MRRYAPHGEREVRRYAPHGEREVRRYAPHGEREVRRYAPHGEREVRRYAPHCEREVRRYAPHFPLAARLPISPTVPAQPASQLQPTDLHQGAVPSGSARSLPAMLSVAVVHRGGAREQYYEREIADDRELYYAGPEGASAGDDGEPVGRWTGQGAAGLGLSGEVDIDGLREMWEGRLPGSGHQLRRMPAAGAVSALDLTFRPPKSVSVIFGLADAEVRTAVASAHDGAVNDALGYLEREACIVRRGHAGAVREPGGGLVVAAFQHHSSRAGDPLLHTHAVAANMAQGPDGRWTALDGRALFGHAKTAGYLYQAALRDRLSEQLGVQWGEVRNGTAEVQGVPRELVDHFSRRRAEIREAMAVEGGKSARAAQLATVRTRRAKQDVDPARQREEWRSRAAEFGFGREQVGELLGRDRGAVRPSRAEVVEEGREMAGPMGLTRRASTFDRRDVIQQWAATHRAGATVGELEWLADHWIASSMVREVDPGELSVRSIIRRGDGKVAPSYFGARYSTADMLEVERELVAVAERRRGEGAGLASEAAVNAALERRSTLRDEQAEMVRALCRSGDGVQVMVGRAGTGKTYALAAAREAWEQSGLPVCGAALSATAARRLETGAGIRSRTVAQLLRGRLDRSGGLDAGMWGGVLVIDEAGMVGTRDLARLVDEADRMSMAVRLVGDDAQLPEIDAGGALRGLAEREGAVELRDVQRQRDAGVRAALEDLRVGDAERYLAGAVDRGAVTVARSPEAQRASAIEHWWADVQAHGHEQTVLLAARHADRRELNELAHERMRDQGRLGDRELAVDGVCFSEGDRVLALRNRRSLGLLNADRGTVSSVTGDRGLEVSLDDGRRVKVPAEYVEAGHLDLGYAMTVHKAQGATFERAHFLGDETVYREQAYTAATRGREETRFYVVAPDPERSLPRGRGDRRLQELARSLGESRAKELAIDVQDRAQTVCETPDAELERRTQALDDLLVERDREAQQAPRMHRPEDLEQDLANAQARLERTREQIRDGGWRARRDRELQAYEASHAHDAEACQKRIEQNRENITAQAQRDREWWEQRRETLSEAVTARAELDRRGREQTCEAIEAAPYEPGRHVTELIGERPGHGDLAGWEEAARRLEAYHHTHQPDTPHIEPPTPNARLEHRQDWDHASKAITRALGHPEWQRELQTRAMDRGHLDHDLGMDIGL